MAMTRDDESELHRLSELLRQIDSFLPEDAPQREALVKAGLALIQAFTSGGRQALEESFAENNAALTETRLAHIRELGLKP
jgi:hypothetical protein